MKTRDPGAPQSDAPLRQKRSNGACRHSGISGAEMDTTRGGRGPTNTETPYPRSLKSYLLEAAGTRPCGRRAAEQRDEVAPFHHRGHSMTGKQARTAETRRRSRKRRSSRCRRTADQLDEVAYFVVLPIRSRAVVRHGLLNPNQAFSNLALALTRSVVSKPSLKDP